MATLNDILQQYLKNESQGVPDSLNPISAQDVDAASTNPPSKPGAVSLQDLLQPSLPKTPAPAPAATDAQVKNTMSNIMQGVGDPNYTGPSKQYPMSPLDPLNNAPQVDTAEVKNEAPEIQPEVSKEEQPVEKEDKSSSGETVGAAVGGDVSENETSKSEGENASDSVVDQAIDATEKEKQEKLPDMQLDELRGIQQRSQEQANKLLGFAMFQQSMAAALGRPVDVSSIMHMAQAALNQSSDAEHRIKLAMSKTSADDRHQAVQMNIKKAAMDLQHEKEMYDPDSALSGFASDMYKQYTGKEAPEGFTYAALAKLSPMLSAKLKTELLTASRERIAKEMADAKASQMRLALQSKLEKMQHDDSKAADTKVFSMLAGARQQPQIMQALKDIYGVDKAEYLYNAYKDPNKFSKQDKALYLQEIAKISSGGKATQAELEHLDPDTYRSRFADLGSKFLNEPTAANLGAFLKRYHSYMLDLRKNAVNTIKDTHQKILDSAPSGLSEEARQKYQKNYIDSLDKNTYGNIASSTGPSLSKEQQQGLAAEIARRKTLREQK